MAGYLAKIAGYIPKKSVRAGDSPEIWVESSVEFLSATQQTAVEDAQRIAREKYKDGRGRVVKLYGLVEIHLNGRDGRKR